MAVETLHPVIMAVPEKDRRLKMRARVACLSRLAREAVHLSAAAAGYRLEILEKDESGVPQPSNGIYWSLTHKPRYVAGVVSVSPVGLDLENMYPRAEALFKKVANENEWALSQGDRWLGFYRFWTAKEAVLKAVGRGLGGLGQCRIENLIDEKQLQVFCKNRLWRVEQCFFNGHVAAIVKNGKRVEWIHSSGG